MSTWQDWKAALTQARLGISPAELQGSLTGYLCGGWGGGGAELLAALELEGDSAGALAARVEQAARAIMASLRAGEPIALVLPATPLEARANALVEWCRGFLGGLGLTGLVGAGPQAGATADLLHTLAHIAAAPVVCGPDDHAALAEVLAFVQTGVARLHAALAPASPGHPRP
ncbi:MAG TPA: UPF0149 family protein [Rhodanobacteraceae bacterium]|nr:UPF0149 family protein [Rhodanobacteraceae bacterium]